MTALLKRFDSGFGRWNLEGCFPSRAGALVGIACLLLSVVTARANPPDPTRSTVAPWDALGKAFVSPGTQSGVDAVTITLLDSGGAPCAGVGVTIQFPGCTDLCIGSPTGLSGTTGPGGTVILDPQVGGCGACTVTIHAGGVLLRQYSSIASPDWDGTQADGAVNAADSAWATPWFLTATYTPCADYNGDLACNLSDAVLFNAARVAGDSQATCQQGLPDSVLSSIQPWDAYGQVFVSPGTQSGVDHVTITVLDIRGAPCAGVPVSIQFSGCTNLCVGSPSGLTGTTGPAGTLTLDPRVGGCEDCDVNVYAGGVLLRQYSRVVSPDWNGYWADGVVNGADSAWATPYFTMATYTPCADYNGDLACNLTDAMLFGAARAAGDSQTLCPPPPPDPALSSVEPWDGAGQLLVSPGTQSGVDRVTITLLDSTGAPCPLRPVQVQLTGCGNLCIGSPDGLSGATGPAGTLVLDPQAGGCDSCDIRVYADGVLLRQFSRIVSPDWNGILADGVVDGADSAYATPYLMTGIWAPCVDYNGDGSVGMPDAAIFSAARAAGDSQPTCLPGPPDSLLSSVDPWDGRRGLLVSPGTQSGIDQTTVTLLDIRGNPCPGVPIDVQLTGCRHLCVGTPDGLTGTTGPAGTLTLDPRVGGCDSCDIGVRAGGDLLRHYSRVVSTDWNGYWADGIVNQRDLNYWLTQYGSGPGESCADYNGDGMVDATDLGLLGVSLSAGDFHPGCVHEWWKGLVPIPSRCDAKLEPNANGDAGETGGDALADDQLLTVVVIDSLTLELWNLDRRDQGAPYPTYGLKVIPNYDEPHSFWIGRSRFEASASSWRYDLDLLGRLTRVQWFNRRLVPLDNTLTENCGNAFWPDSLCTMVREVYTYDAVRHTLTVTPNVRSCRVTSRERPVPEEYEVGPWHTDSRAPAIGPAAPPYSFSGLGAFASALPDLPVEPGHICRAERTGVLFCGTPAGGRYDFRILGHRFGVHTSVGETTNSVVSSLAARINADAALADLGTYAKGNLLVIPHLPDDAVTSESVDGGLTIQPLEEGCDNTRIPEDLSAGAGESPGYLSVSPNPTALSTSIRFNLGGGGPVTLVIYDLSGSPVRRLADRLFEAGTQTVEWDGRDDAGRPVPSGIYFLRARGAERTSNIKILVTR